MVATLDYFQRTRGPLRNGLGVVGGWQITSYFGGRPNPFTGQASYHGGQDLAYGGCLGDPVYSPCDGSLAQAWDNSGGGNWSGITFDDGSYMGIGHARAFAPGNHYRRVKAGDLIAYCGTSGASTGPHLHIAYRAPNARTYSDPYDLLQDAQYRIVGVTQPEPNPGTLAMAQAQFRFPDGTTYVMNKNPRAPEGAEWVWVPDPQALADGIVAGSISTVEVHLASGNDGADALWERYPVASGPHKRS